MSVASGLANAVAARRASPSCSVSLNETVKCTQKVVPDASRKSLIPEIISQVPRGTRISSDEWAPYRVLSALGYDHNTVDHGAKNWANGDTHVNMLEAFWSMLKRSIWGTHIHVSQKHLSKYLGEFEYRYNLRKQPGQMFARLLESL